MWNSASSVWKLHYFAVHWTHSRLEQTSKNYQKKQEEAPRLPVPWTPKGRPYVRIPFARRSIPLLLVLHSNLEMSSSFWKFMLPATSWCNLFWSSTSVLTHDFQHLLSSLLAGWSQQKPISFPCLAVTPWLPIITVKKLAAYVTMNKYVHGRLGGDVFYCWTIRRSYVFNRTHISMLSLNSFAS